ncbi:unnamed protein product [Medioppia subpectinata]|uniref:Uncharacterized protein n=1 Tax=Medioppia subpectinata TaxID=1979941 RepID=A0A7R9KY36_9ACAR|nr:unnamed protein product [Medioppia subpectinata]CAG2111761.1 unnamed protein product [Medioppia subpectinata]
MYMFIKIWNLDNIYSYECVGVGGMAGMAGVGGVADLIRNRASHVIVGIVRLAGMAGMAGLPMSSRYSKGNSGTTSSVGFGAGGGPSALNLYTNKSANNKSASSGYTSDHYSSPSALHSLPGYVSDVGGSSSHVSSKASYLQTNAYGSSPGVKTYSSYSNSYLSNTMFRNLSTNTSRMPSINYSYSSGSSGYARNASPRYVSHTRPERTTQTNHTNHELNNNNNSITSITNTTNKSKTPAEFSSDSEGEENHSDIICHTNIIVTSRATSPNRERDVTNARLDSISATQQIIRPKKVVFGVVLANKCSQQTQCTHSDFHTDNRLSISPALTPNRSLTPTPALSSPTLSPALSPSVTPCHSPSPVRMRYGCTPNRRPANTSNNSNRYSMPVMTITTTSATDFSNYSSVCNSNDSQTENTMSAKPFNSSNNSIQNSFEMPVIGDQTSQSRSRGRISPSILRRRRSKSRGRLSGRSRSRSKEKLLDREESSTTTSSSSDDEELQKNKTADRHSRLRKKKSGEKSGETNHLQTCNTNDDKTNGITVTEITIGGMNLTTKAKTDSSSSQTSDSNHNKRTNTSNESSSSPEKVIIRKPAMKAPKIEPMVVVTRLPIKIKDPYSTETECEDIDSEFVDESDVEKFRSSIPSTVTTIKLIANHSKPLPVIQVSDNKSSTDNSSESSDNSAKSLESVIGLNGHCVQKSATVIEVNKDQRNGSIDTTDSEEQSDKSVKSSDSETKESSFVGEDDKSTFKDGSVRDSGFSESSTRPDSPYDCIKFIDNSYGNDCKHLTESVVSNEIHRKKPNNDDVNDIEPTIEDRSVQTMGAIECKDIHAVPSMADETRNGLNLNLLSKEEDDSVAVDVSDVKVHNGEAMKSTVEAYTEEIDSSAVRIRENKSLSVHLSKITEEIEEDFNQTPNLMNRKYAKNKKWPCFQSHWPRIRKKRNFEMQAPGSDHINDYF